MSFTEIALLLVVAAAAAALAKLLKQPLIIGYLFAGLALTSTGIINDIDAVSSLGKIGVALLLFLVGLEMNLKELPSLGKIALLTGLGQIVFTSVVGFLIAFALGFTPLAALYIAVALTFSSTIIIVKLLSEKGDLGSLYGKIAVGFLLVQDFVAILTLMFLAGLGEGGVNASNFLVISVKAVLLFVAVVLLSKKILPTLFDKFLGGSSELLFMGAIAWALGVSALVGGPLGFSFEIGGFLAGLSLSSLPEHLGIAAKTRPLRDFFLTIFFLALGASLLTRDILSVLTPAVIFSLFVLVGNPLIVMIIMGIMRYKKRTSFLASVTVAQISEFSFILMAMGYSLGHVSQADVALVVAVGIITMTASTYLILASDKIYLKIGKFLSVFERKVTQENVQAMKSAMSDHIVLLGCNRMGNNLISFFKRKKTPFLVVDHDPKVFARLSAEKTPVVFGDIEDNEVLDLANIEGARMVISSVPSQEDNLSFLEYLKSLKRKPTTIVKSQTRENALRLYEAGATYAIVPEVVAGEFLRHIFASHGISEERFKKMGKSHFERLITA